jgi:hypothetical protein
VVAVALLGVAVQATDPERVIPAFSAVLPMLDETV